MAAPDLTNKILILLGDGGTPTEVFGSPCGANTRSLKLTTNTGEEVLLDCDDPLGTDAFISRWAQSKDTSLSLSGRVAKSALATWLDWANATNDEALKNIRVEIEPGNVGVGGHLELPAILQEFEIGAEGKETATFTATIVGAGTRTWVPAT